MKRILILVITTLSLSYNLFSQTIIAFDYMETSNWNGLWFNSGNLSSNGGQSTWATNVSVSSNVSAVLYGAGNGSSFIEQDWYVLPNITGLDPNKLYQLQFKLASHSFTAPTANTRGVDMPDFVEVQVSYNILQTVHLQIPHLQLVMYIKLHLGLILLVFQLLF